MLPDVGGLGQTAVMVSSARLVLRESEPLAKLVAGNYLAAGGVGTLVVTGASAEQLAELAAHGPDTRVTADGEGREVVLSPRPAWWPGTPGDDVALAYWRGSIAATRWLVTTLEK
jgi:hypothetical protein